MNENDITATVNWNIKNDKLLKDAIKYSFDAPNEDADLDDIVSFESCLNLHSSSDTNEKCILSISSLNHAANISHLIIVSEAKHLELYSDKGEYLTTVNADFIIKMDGFVVNKAVIALPNPLKSCNIKFLSLSIPSEFWLYGVQVTVKQINIPPNSPSNVDFSKVMHRVQQYDKKISENAKGFANFLYAYQNGAMDTSKMASTVASNEMTNIFKKFNLGFESSGDSEIPKQLRSKPQTALNTTIENDLLGCSPYGEIREIVRQEVASSEKRLWNQIDARLTAIETRQMCLLEQLSQLVHPQHTITAVTTQTNTAKVTQEEEN